MKRILYGAPSSEREEDNILVAMLRDRKTTSYVRKNKLINYVRDRNKVTYINDGIDFSWELRYCRDSLFFKPRYDLVMYDFRMYGKDWLPQISVDFYNSVMLQKFEKVSVPVIILSHLDVDEYMKDCKYIK